MWCGVVGRFLKRTNELTIELNDLSDGHFFMSCHTHLLDVYVQNVTFLNKNSIFFKPNKDILSKNVGMLENVRFYQIKSFVRTNCI